MLSDGSFSIVVVIVLPLLVSIAVNVPEVCWIEYR